MKALNVAAAIIAILALVGDVFFMIALLSLGESVSAFSELEAAGLGGPEVQELGRTFSFALSMGWLWAVLVLITGIFAIKFAVFDARKK